MCPSGLNATASTVSLCPVRGLPMRRGRVVLLMSHSITVRSALTVASVCPSGVKATDHTESVCSASDAS